MGQMISDRRDIDFILYEQLKVQDLTKHDRFKDFTKKTCDMIITEARNLAVKEILPTNMEADKEGVSFENGEVKVPESFHRLFKLFREGEWIAMIDDPEVGGQGMPVLLSMPVSEYFTGANCSFGMYPGVCHGAGKLVEIFGTERQKELFLKKMYTGIWGGSMVLTESGAGSDVGAVETTAVKNDDGTYSISGNKIFITAGEHNLTENIIHPVLARIEGAPAGTKGISLFLVPKIRVNEDGSLGEFNDVVCTGIEEKMGIHASSTCSLTFGGKGQCQGELLGQENKGMRAMFQMMNEARLGVGLQGFAMASSAYMYALDYAKERKQGKNLLSFMDPNASSVSIIEHPDVRRMLMFMKSYVEGMRSFIYFVGYCFDMTETSEDQDEKEKYNNFIELLTPLIKGYCTDRAFEVCTQAVQTYGGYGYTSEYPVEQLLRDCKITGIYEGTNGIQAMDLLGRKLGMKKGKPLMDLLGEINKTLAAAKAQKGLEDLAGQVETAVNKLGELAMHIGATAMSEKVMTAFSFATPFLEVTGDVIMAWMHLWRATIAAPKLEKLAGSVEPQARKEKALKNKEAAFYEGVWRTAEYYITCILPGTMGKMEAVKACNDSMIEIPEVSFGG